MIPRGENLLVQLIKKAVGLPAGNSNCCGTTSAPDANDCCGTPAAESSSIGCGCAGITHEATEKRHAQAQQGDQEKLD